MGRIAGQPAVQPPADKCNKGNPSAYDHCPKCGMGKAKAAKGCRNCRFVKPVIEQPSDPTIRHIALTRGFIAIVDAFLYEWLMQWKWCAIRKPRGRNWYAVRGEGSRRIYMARQITGVTGRKDVDHDNGNGLDNRGCNLRLANRSQNSANAQLSRANTSGYKGVCWHKKAEKWIAHIKVNGKGIYLGLFLVKEDAARAYNAAALRYFGEFARLNQI